MRSLGTDRLRAALGDRQVRRAVVGPGERPLAWADIGRDVTGPGDPEPTGGQWIGTSVALYVEPPGRGGGNVRADGDGVTGGPDGGDRVAAVRLPWADIGQADWDADTQELHVVATDAAAGGGRTTSHVARLLGADRLLQLVRERVTSALVHQRSVPLRSGGEATISARRATGTDGPLAWSVELPRGVDPDDREVAREVADALAAARADLGVRPAPA